MTVIDHGRGLRELKIVTAAERRVVVRASGSTKLTKVKRELQPNITNILRAAIIDWPIHNRLENGSVGYSGGVVHHILRRVMKGHDGEVIHIEPALAKMLLSQTSGHPRRRSSSDRTQRSRGARREEEERCETLPW
jgi:hypothetical protein